MGRKITFNLLNGQGTPVDIAHGWLSIRPTQEYTNGSYLVLATSTERRVTNGTVVFPDVQPSPGVDANTGKYPWCYMFTYRDSNGYKTSWYAAVPEGTGDLLGSDLLILVPDDVHYTIMRGPKGDDGDGLRVLGAFPTFEALQAAVPNPIKGDSYIVGTKVYVWDGAAWGASGDLTGAKGEKGDKGDTGARGATGQTGQTGATGATPVISAVANTGEPGSTVSVVKTGTDTAPVLTFTIPRGNPGEQGLPGTKGDKGDKGDTGNTGAGVPVGGESGQVIVSDGADSTFWASPASTITNATETERGLMSADDKVRLNASVSADTLLGSTKRYLVSKFGGVGDGVTDDATAIKNAINAAYADGGGTVVFDGGSTKTYNTTIINLRSGVNLTSDGAKVMSATGYNMFQGIHETDRAATGYGAGPSNFTVSNLHIIGDLATGKGGNFTLHHSDNVLFVDCWWDGATPVHAMDLCGCSNIRVLRCRFTGTGNTDNTKEAIQVDFSTAIGNSSRDVLTNYDGASSVDITVEDCIFEPGYVGTTKYPAPVPIGSHGASEINHKRINFLSNTVTDALASSSGAFGSQGWVHFYSIESLSVKGNKFIHTGTGPSHAITTQTTVKGIKTSDAQNPSASIASDIIPQRQKDIRIEGNLFSGFKNTANGSYVVGVLGVANPASDDQAVWSVAISGNTFTDIYSGTGVGVGNDAILLAGCRGAYVGNNLFSESKNMLRTTNSAQLVTLTNNTARNLRGQAVVIEGTGNYGWAVTNNSISYMSQFIRTAQVGNMAISGNLVTGSLTPPAGETALIGLNSAQNVNINANVLEAKPSGGLAYGVSLVSSTTRILVTSNICSTATAAVTGTGATTANNIT